MTEQNWQQPVEFETIANANKPFSLRVPALVVTRGKNGCINLMLSMWFTPMGLEPSCFLVAIDRKTKTCELIDETGEFVIAAPEEDLFEEVLYSGAVSGHDEDKWEACGLTPLQPKCISVPLVREAVANVELKVSRVIPFDEEYALYVGEVMACHVKKDSFDDGIYLPASKPLLWLGKGTKSPRGEKTAVRYAAGLGRIWEADETAPILSRIKKKKTS